MRVRALVLLTGPLGNWRPGDVCEVPEATARQWIADRAAEALPGPPPPPPLESAALAGAPETATLPSPPRRGRKP